MTYNEKPRVFNSFLSEEPSFEVMTGYVKAFSKIYQGRCRYEFEKEVLNKCLTTSKYTDEKICFMDSKTGYIACVNKKGITRIFLS